MVYKSLIQEIKLDNIQGAIRMLSDDKLDINERDDRGKTALHYAVQKGMSGLAGLLIKKGFDIFEKDNNNETPIFLAKDNIELMGQLLISFKNQESPQKKFENVAEYINCASQNIKDDLFIWTVKEGYLEIAKYILIVCGANINAIDENGKTALFYAVENDSKNDTELSYKIVEWLVQNDADLNVEDIMGNKPLHYAKQYNPDDVYEKKSVGLLLILNGGRDYNPSTVNARYGALKGINQIMAISAVENNYNIVSEFIRKANPDLSVLDHKGYSALSYAKHNCNESVSYLLEENGVKERGIVKDDFITQYITREIREDVGTNHSNYSHLYKAIFSEKDVMKKLTYIEQAIQDEKDIALFDAVKHSDKKNVVFLIKNGANVTKINEHGRTPLYYASIHSEKCKEIPYRCNKSMCELLLEYGGYDFSTNMINKKFGAAEKTQLMIAAEQGRNEVVDKILSNIDRESINEIDSEGYNAYSYAMGFKKDKYNYYYVPDNIKNSIVKSLKDKKINEDERIFLKGEPVQKLFILLKSYIKSGSVILAKQLLDNISQSMKDKVLFHAVQENAKKDSVVTRKAVLVIIECGANVNSLDQCGYTPLYYAKRYSLDYKNVYSVPSVGEMIIAKDGYSFEPDVINAQYGENRITQLMYAAGKCKLYRVEAIIARLQEILTVSDLEKALDKCDSNLNTAYTYFQVADECINEYSEFTLEKMQRISNFLISKGMDKTEAPEELVDIMKKRINTPLSVGMVEANVREMLEEALAADNSEFIENLLQEGIDKELVLENGRNIIEIAVENRAKRVTELLLSKNVSLNDQLLLNAAQNCDYNLIEKLLQKGLDIRTVDVNGNTLIHLAALSGNYSVVDFLIKNGLAVNEVNNFGVSPLHMAVFSGNTKIVKLLIANKANVFERDRNGRTPAMVAKYRGEKEIYSLLEEGRCRCFEGICNVGNLLISNKISANKVESAKDGIDLIEKIKGYISFVDTVSMEKILQLTKQEVKDEALFSAIKFNAVIDNSLTRQIVKELVRGGAYVNALDNRNLTPLFYAKKYNKNAPKTGDYSVGELLMINGGKSLNDKIVNAQYGDYGVTQLMIAAGRADIETVREIVDKFTEMARKRYSDADYDLIKSYEKLQINKKDSDFFSAVSYAEGHYGATLKDSLNFTQRRRYNNILSFLVDERNATQQNERKEEFKIMAARYVERAGVEFAKNAINVVKVVPQAVGIPL